MTSTEPGRQAAQILLDMISVHDPDDDDASVAAMELAFERLHEVGAVTATITGENDVALDLTGLLGGTLTLLATLLPGYARALALDEVAAIAQARETVDNALGT